MLLPQDDGTVGDEAVPAAVVQSPGSVSLGTHSSEEDDEEDGAAAEHRVSVRTGRLLACAAVCR